MAINFAGFLRWVLKNGGFDGGLEFGFLKCLVARLHHSLVPRLHHFLTRFCDFLGFERRMLLSAFVSRLHHCLVSRLHHFTISVAVGGFFERVFGTQIRLG
jgi:hypothetical protein